LGPIRLNRIEEKAMKDQSLKEKNRLKRRNDRRLLHIIMLLHPDVARKYGFDPDKITEGPRLAATAWIDNNLEVVHGETN